MANQEHRITQGDTLTPLAATLQQKNASGNYEAVDVTSKDVKFCMVKSDDTTKVALTDSNVSKVDAANGKVQYDFQAADVDTAGTFYAWFVVQSGGESDTFPVKGRVFSVVISASEARS